jgi:hypothetical protein
VIEVGETVTATFHPASALDYIPASQLRELQLARLQAVVRRAWEAVPLMRTRMEEKGLSSGGVRRLEDLVRLPFTLKSDLRDTYPFGLFASPMQDIVGLHASSGTTGKPIVVAYTREDLDVWTSVMMRCFAACGLHEGDIVQNAYGYGLFTGGLGAHYGAESLGATVIPISGGNTDRQIMVMKDFGVTAIFCTPSYFIHLLERAGQLGIDMRALPLRAGVFGAEPWTESMRRRIESESGVKAFDIYGLSEIIGPGVAIECPFQQGLHIFEDHFLPENKPGHLLDPCRLLARAGVDIRTLSLADTREFGILRLIVSDWQEAAELLRRAGYVVKSTEVLAVDVPDRPGGLADVLEAFEGSGINIEYMYAFPFARDDKAVLIFRFDQPDAAISLLQRTGINVIESVGAYRS